MANRYWVGGTETWNATAGSKWSTTSGGAGGAAVPTAADDVFFNAASGAVTVSTSGVTGFCVARSVTCIGFTGQINLANVAAALTIGDASGGALTLSATMTVVHVGSASGISFVSTSTNGGAGWPITTAGKSLQIIRFDGNGGKWTLQDDLTTTGTVTLFLGHWDTGNFAWSGTAFSSSANGARTFSPGSSAISLSSTGTAWSTATVGNLTMSANTAVVTMTGAGGAFTSGTKDWNGMSLVMSGSGAQQISSTNATLTFANFTRTATAVKTDSLTLFANITCTGTMTLSGNSVINRLFITSSVLGTQRTLTAATVVADNVDFVDVIGAGAGSWNLSAGSVGIAGNVSGITGTTPATQTASVAVGSWSWSDASRWTSRVPLPQDNVICVGSAAGTITIDMPRAGKNIDFTGSTRALALTVNTTFYGSLTLSATMTLNSATGTPTLGGRENHTLTWNGKSWNGTSGSTLQINCAGGTYTMLDDLTFTNSNSGVFPVHASGTLDMNGFDLYLNGLTSSAVAQPCRLIGHDGTIHILTAGSNVIPWSMGAAADPDLDETTIIFDSASAGTRTFNGGSKTYGKLEYTVENSSGILAITGNNNFGEIEVASARAIQFVASATQNVVNWNISGENYSYLRLPGVSGAAAYVDDSAALDITDDIAISYDGSMDNWDATAQIMFSKSDGTTQRSYFLGTATNALQFRISYDGAAITNHNSSVSTGFTPGAYGCVGVTRERSSGDIKFWTAPTGTSTHPGGAGWTQLGTTVVGATTAMFNSTARGMVGALNTAASASLMSGNVKRVQVWSDVTGTTKVLDMDFTTKAFGANSFTESSPNAATSTIMGIQAQAGDGRVTIQSSSSTQTTLTKAIEDSQGNFWNLSGAPTINDDHAVLTGTQYLFTPDRSSLDITGDLELSGKIAADDYTPATNQVLVSKWDATGGHRSYLVWLNATGRLRLYLSEDGINPVSADSTVLGLTDGQDIYWKITWRQSDGRVQFFTSTDGAIWTQVGSDGAIAIASIHSGIAELRAGSIVSGSGDPFVGKMYSFTVKNGIDGTTVASLAVAKSIVSSNYLVITDSNATGAGTWYAGANSIDLSNNDGWVFENAPSNQGNFFQFI